MILVVVRKAGWQKSNWDSYTKTFDDEAAFLDWWTKLPEDSYTKKVSRDYERVRIFKVDGEITGDLLAPFAPPAPGKT